MSVRTCTAWLAVLLLGVGCERERAGCFTTMGPATEVTIPLEAAVAVLEIEGRVDISWRPESSAPQATIRTGEGLVDGIHVHMQDGILRIADRNTCHWVRDLSIIPEVVIEGVRPDTVLLLGQGRFSMLDTLTSGNLTVVGDEMAGSTALLFAADTLQVRMPNGLGHVQVEGSARRFRSFRSGFGDLDAAGLRAEEAMVHHAGVGRCDLQPAAYLYLELAGHGDVHLWGAQQNWNIYTLDGAEGQVLYHP